MRKRFVNIIFLVCWGLGLIVAYQVGKLVSSYIFKRSNPEVYKLYEQRKFEDSLIRSIGMDTYVFEVTAALSTYYISMNNYFDSVNYPQATELKSSTALKKLHKNGRNLIIKLRNADHHYRNSLLSAEIKNFLNWFPKFEKQLGNWGSVARQDKFDWLKFSKEYQNKTDTIRDTLRHIVGFSDIDDKQNALTMLLVASSVNQLKNKIDSADLCLVMRNTASNSQVRAQQIAFMEFGNKYCPSYYNKLASWVGGDFAQNTIFDKSKYDSLSYSEYYNKYVLPAVPEALSSLDKEDWEYRICGLRRGVEYGPRNPKKDALRVIWRKYHTERCPKITKAPTFSESPLMCLVLGEILGNKDLFDRCKLTDGVLV